MQIAHHRLHALIEHMRIDLRRRNVGVAEQFLHDAQIRAVLQKMAGKGMAQHMRADARRRYAGGPAIVLISRAKTWRLRCPLSPSAGKSQALAAARGSAFSSSVRYSVIAARAGSEIGTMRSRPPLPRTRIKGSRLRAALFGRQTSSETRKPVA